ncbi:RNA polymerase sigma factor [Streptomyces sp. NEAU-174]|uniref:RNA polymerase sigma factor n=1 Tax=Streptomyces sp. NEAU-174 TaxID=3458254 RepID=UPI004044AC97
MPSNAPDEPPLDFQAFYQQYHRPYLRYTLLHLGDSAVAIETVEAAFAELLQSWTDVLTAPSVQRYAHSVLRSAITSRQVATGRDSAFVQTATFARVRAAARRQLEVLESSLGLYAAIARLPERQMDVILFRFVLGYDLDKVAEMMGVSNGTVRSHIHAARRQLAKDLGIRGNSLEEEEIV